MSIDSAIFYRFYGAQGLWLWVMAGLTVVGSGWALVPIAAAGTHPKLRSHVLRLVGVLLAVAVAVLALKALFGRARPCACLADVHALVFAAPTDPSFPSGHAAGAFAFAVYVALEARVHVLAKAALFAMAAGIALSRVVLGVHFPSDVVSGALLGCVVGALGASRSARKDHVEQRDRHTDSHEDGATPD
jgi:undecaprenyl-diphosphatase